MRVFVTGASGWVGSAVVRELITAGHKVTGLARTDASAAALSAAGAEVHRGSLEDADSLRSGAVAADGVIHCGFNHDFSKFLANCAMDRTAIDVIGTALIGTKRPFVVTSATGQAPSNRLITEADAADANKPRAQSESSALSFASRGVRVSVIRLPASVHGEGDHAFVPELVNIARSKKVAAYVGEGRNVWPSVHRNDAARLFRMVLESGTAGSVYHAVGEQGVPMRDIASLIGRRLNVPVVSKSAEEAADHFGWIARFVSMDNPTSSAETQKQLGWTPTQPTLLTDMDQYYFN